MKAPEKYSIWIKLTFAHAYFGKAACGIIPEPDAATAAMLRKAGIVFKQLDALSWLLIAPEKMLLGPGDELVFRLKAQSPDFFYYTGEAYVESDGCSIEEGSMGSWKTLKIVLNEETIASGETIAVAMSSLSRYFEYLVFPPEKNPPAKLEVREEKGAVKFKKAEELAFPGTEKYLLRFVSSEPLPLERKAPYRFHLWEVRKGGDNQLARLLDAPPVKASSPFSPKDTITSYFYL
jgi:hypothetical protein